MKKILSIFILICTVFMCACTPTKVVIQECEDSVATLTIVSFDGSSESMLGLMNLGHAFIAITNNSSEDVSIGKYTLKPSRCVTIGTWSIAKHFGIWYNVESNYIEYCNKYDGRVSLSKNINAEDINKINNFISTHDKWGILKNCSYFATNIWNEVAKDGEYFKSARTPKSICKTIVNSDDYKINEQFVVSGEIGYYDGDNWVGFKLQGEHYAKI